MMNIITINRVIVGVGLFGCAYAMVFTYKRYFQWKRQQTFEELLKEISMLHAELLEIKSSNRLKFNEAVENQLIKYAWQTLDMENQKKSSNLIENVMIASKYAAERLKPGRITEIHLTTIHGELTKGESFSGQYRNHDVLVNAVPNSKYGHFYPPPLGEVEELMSKFMEWLNMQKYTDPVDVLKFAIEAKVRFLKIHPFLDGNGPTSRAIFNGLLGQVSYPWVEIPSSDKYRYYHSLEAYYHEMNMAPICSLVAQYVKDALQNAISDVKKSTQ